MTDQKDLIRRLAYGLDACLDHLAKEAEKERRREEGKSLRQITNRQMHGMAHDAVVEAFALLGLDADGPSR